MNLFTSIFKSVFKRRDVMILMAFALLPLLVAPLADVQDRKQAVDFTSSAIAYFNSGIETQFQLLLPSLMFGLIVSSVFHDEITSGILFLYKDLKRSAIFNAKLLSLVAVYGIYLFLTFVVSVLAYYVYLAPTFHFEPKFWIAQGTGQVIFMQIVTTIAFHLISMAIVAAVSIKKTTIQAVLAGILFTLISMTAPLWNGFRYIAPNTYPKLIDTLSFGSALLISLSLTLLYFGLAYWTAKRRFDTIEY
ncbi:hypothetical protein [Streptococcus ovis]|uniref:hypothetical protein n=1 Tax=Streptococcus ovis TaxID=82806 RepID=UPI000373401D|nr:hypothetical protein [Streptococcus ovis]